MLADKEDFAAEVDGESMVGERCYSSRPKGRMSELSSEVASGRSKSNKGSEEPSGKKQFAYPDFDLESDLAVTRVLSPNGTIGRTAKEF